MNDEPNLIAAALRANAAHRPAAVGLYGSFGVAYGPLPTQLYQLLLLFTHDPVKMVAARAVVTAAATAGALAWLARTLRLARWFVPAVLASPYLWLFERILWDNTFAIPVGVLAVAGYAHFLATGSGRSLVAAVACAAALPVIHFMAAPLAVAVGGHAAWRHRASLVRHRRGLLAVLAVAIAANAGYVALGASKGWERYRPAGGRNTDSSLSPRPIASEGGGPSVRRLRGGETDGAGNAWYPYRSAVISSDSPAPGPAATGHADRPGRWAAALFPLLGGRLLGAEGFYMTPRLPGAAGAVVRGASRMGVWLVWGGIVLAAARLLAACRSGRPATPRDVIGGIALVALAGQMALYGAMRVAPYTHYFNGLAAVYLLLAWLAVDAIRPPSVRGAVIGGYALAVGGFTAACAAQAHRAGGGGGPFGPSLANQMAVAAALDAYPDAVAWTDVKHYADHPHALWTLRRLRQIPPPTGAASGRLLIHGEAGEDGEGRVRVIESDPPAGGTQMLLWPLPP